MTRFKNKNYDKFFLAAAFFVAAIFSLHGQNNGMFEDYTGCADRDNIIYTSNPSPCVGQLMHAGNIKWCDIADEITFKWFVGGQLMEINNSKLLLRNLTPKKDFTVWRVMYVNGVYSSISNKININFIDCDLTQREIIVVEIPRAAAYDTIQHIDTTFVQFIDSTRIVWIDSIMKTFIDTTQFFETITDYKTVLDTVTHFKTITSHETVFDTLLVLEFNTIDTCYNEVEVESNLLLVDAAPICKLTIYPNPTPHCFWLDLPCFYDVDDITLTIVNDIGQVFYRGKFKEKHCFELGTYFVNIDIIYNSKVYRFTKQVQIKTL